MLNIVLFGPPGSGKGTQAALLIEKYGLLHISTGDLLREERAAASPLGLEAQKFMDKGMLVPDEVVIGMISGKLDSRPDVSGIIFDGFPRTVPQAEALDKLLKLKQTGITKMIALQVGEEELINRMLNRGKTSGRADDQDPAIVQNRIKVYHEQTAVVADFYGSQGKFVAIEGEGTIEEIFQRLCSQIDPLLIS